MTDTLASRMAALADRLEADAPHSTSENGLLQAAEEIRAELAAEGPQKMWTVCHSDWGEDGLIAALTTPELANGFAKQQTGSVEVYEETIHDHIPTEVSRFFLSFYLLHDGTAHRNSAYSQTGWDCEQPDPLTVTHYEHRDYVEVCRAERAEAERAVFEKVQELIRDRQAEDGQPEGWASGAIAAAKTAIFGPVRTATHTSYCYAASFGRVHYSTSCRCPR